MRRNYLIYSILFLFCNLSFAQDFDNYELLKSTGKIPKDFLIPSSEKYKKESENIDAKAKKREQKDQKQFFLESNFLIDDLLQSAKVLFNDPITAYVNKIADELLKEDDAMRQKLRFYAVRSSAVNAFATNQGIIFVNVGLVAQLESEAQLAFILAHEISHVKHGHALDMFLESQKIDRYTRRSELMKNTSFDDRIVAKNFFSKDLEISADKEGLELYLESKYSLDDLDGVFDVLQYSYLPFDVTPFKKDFFENKFITFPENYFLAEEDLNGINGDYEEEDSKSTHPSIESRRENSAATVANHNNSGRSSFITSSKEEFFNVRDIARFESAYYYLHAFRYQEAIYACYILQQRYPNSLYLKKIISKALYGYTKFKNEMKGVKPYSVSYSDDDIYLESMAKDAHEEIEGSAQQVYYFLAQLEPNELTVFALRYVWDAIQGHPDDKELEKIREDLFLELSYHYEKRSEFSSQSMEQIQDEKLAKVKSDSINKATNNSSPPKKLSKYDKIKKQKKEQETIDEEEIEPEEFAKYAFRDILKDKKFKKLFLKGQEEKEDREARSEYYNSTEGRAELQKRRKRNTVALGIDSLLVYTPYYASIETTRDGKSKIDYLRSEKKQIELVDILRQNAKKAKVAADIIDVSAIQETDSEAFNDLRILAEWISQQSRFGSNILMPGFNQEYADKIIKKYHHKYLLFTGIVSMKKGRGSWIYWSILFDLRNGAYQVIKKDYYGRKDSKVMLNAHIFDTFFQIKFKRKK
jgi:hypothetical protein